MFEWGKQPRTRVPSAMILLSLTVCVCVCVCVYCKHVAADCVLGQLDVAYYNLSFQFLFVS